MRCWHDDCEWLIPRLISYKLGLTTWCDVKWKHLSIDDPPMMYPRSNLRVGNARLNIKSWPRLQMTSIAHIVHSDAAMRLLTNRHPHIRLIFYPRPLTREWTTWCNLRQVQTTWDRFTHTLPTDWMVQHGIPIFFINFFISGVLGMIDPRKKCDHKSSSEVRKMLGCLNCKYANCIFIRRRL